MLIHSVSAAAVGQAAPAQPATASGTPRAAQPSAPAPAPAEAAVLEAAAAATQAVRSLASSLEFSVDRQTGKTIVRVIDTATHEVIRQIPSEEMLAIARALDHLQGLLVHGTA